MESKVAARILFLITLGETINFPSSSGRNTLQERCLRWYFNFFHKLRSKGHYSICVRSRLHFVGQYFLCGTHSLCRKHQKTLKLGTIIKISETVRIDTKGTGCKFIISVFDEHKDTITLGGPITVTLITQFPKENNRFVHQSLLSLCTIETIHVTLLGNCSQQIFWMSTSTTL